jgi:hypothetical protein
MRYGHSAACTQSCAGSSEQNCGGTNSSAVYSRGFSYEGFYADCVNNQRALPELAIDGGSLTLGACFLSCQSYGYSYFAGQDSDQQDFFLLNEYHLNITQKF